MLKVVSAQMVTDVFLYVQFSEAVRLLDDSAPSDALTESNYLIVREGGSADAAEVSSALKVSGRTDMVALRVDPKPTPFERYGLEVEKVAAAGGAVLDPASRKATFRGFSLFPSPPLDEGNPFTTDIAEDPSTGDWKVGTDGDYDTHKGKSNVVKKITRRLATRPGDFPFLERFGVATPLKETFTQAGADRFESEAKVQILQERAVSAASVKVVRGEGGEFTADVRARLRAGAGDDSPVGQITLSVNVRDQGQ